MTGVPMEGTARDYAGRRIGCGNNYFGGARPLEHPSSVSTRSGETDEGCWPDRFRTSVLMQDELEIEIALEDRVVVVGDQRHDQRAIVAFPHVEPFHVVDLVAHVGFHQ